MNRCFTSILCADPGQTAPFYEQILGMTRHGDFGWFIILTHPNMPGLEFGLLERGHESVPAEIAAAPAGVMVTFVVEDLDGCYVKAKALDAPILQEPALMPYGQRRLLLRDPEGTVIDISSPAG